MKQNYPPRLQKNLKSIVLSGAIYLLWTQAIASDVTWTGTDGNWSEGVNWSTTPNPPATSGDSIIFNAPASSYTSTIDDAWSTAGSVNGITINDNGAAAGTLTLEQSNLTSFTIGSGGITNNRTAGTITLRGSAGYTIGADQTWTTSGVGQGTNGRILIWSDLKGAGNLTFIGTSEFTFVGGSSAEWTGNLTAQGTVRINQASQFSRLGETFTMQNTLSGVSLYMPYEETVAAHSTVSSNIVFDNTGSSTYNFTTNGGQLGTIDFAGDWSSSSTLNESIYFYSAVNDPSVFKFTLSGDNSGLTSSITSGSSGALYLRQGFIQLDSDNAIGAGNSLYVTLGDSNNNTSTPRNAGLLTSDGHDVSATIRANINYNTTPTEAPQITLGLTGTGNAEFTSNVILGSSNTDNLEAADLLLSADDGGVVMFSGVIQDQNSTYTQRTENVKIIGGGQVVLSGANTYTAATTVSENSTLLINNTLGSGTGTGAVVVESGSSLGGTGFIAPGDANGVTAQSGAFIAPGASIENIVFDGASTSGALLTADAGATFVFELDANGGTPDQIDFWNYASGDLILSDNAVDLSLVGIATESGEYTVSLFQFYGDDGSNLTISGITSGLTIGDLGEGISAASFVYNSAGGTIDLNYSVIPEASTWGYLGLISVLAIAFKSRHSKA